LTSKKSWSILKTVLKDKAMAKRLIFGISSFVLFLSIYPLAKTESLSFQLIYQMKGQSLYDQFGSSVAGIGDANNDGTPDFIVGAYRASPNSLTYAGSAYIYSGIDGSLIYQKNGTDSMDFLGAVAGAGDVNGDGTPDFMVGANGTDVGEINRAGSAFVYSGIDGSLLFRKDGTDSYGIFGGVVGSAGDINGDGKSDFIIGAPDAFNLDQGAAYIYSGADGNLLFQINGTLTFRGFGISVDSLGDINGDQRSDIIIGAYFATPDTFLQAGSAFVYSGADTSLIYRVDGIANDQYLGLSVAGLGDVNSDGKSDFIVGAYLANPGGLNSTGAAYVYSGADGLLLHEINGYIQHEWFGYSVTGIGDIDADGKNDFAVGAPHYNPFIQATAPGKVYVYSGATGALVGSIGGNELYDGFGISIADAGDLNGDDRNELVIGSPGADTGRGAAYVYSLVPTDASEERSNRPNQFELSQNYPNPFNPTTTIQYFLPKREKATLEIFNLLGERVRALIDGEQTAGEHTVVWDGKDENRRILSSGIYFYRLKGESFSEIKKMTFLK
jgi:FG-GAP repeat protein/flagellar hook capping protein FlgD